MANESCIYIGEIGDGNGAGDRIIYKVKEPQTLQNGNIPLLDTYRFT
jgi:hypothetical protein